MTAPDLAIAHVVVWSNGMVSVFDAAGEQLPKYQGRLADVQALILEAAPPSTHFEGGTWHGRLFFLLSRERFAALQPRADVPVVPAVLMPERL